MSIEESHNHPVNKEAFQFLPKQRRLDEQELEEVETILTPRPNKKILQNHIRQKTGKKVTLRDIVNHDAKMKPTRTNLEDILGDVSGSGEDGHKDNMQSLYDTETIKLWLFVCE